MLYFCFFTFWGHGQNICDEKCFKKELYTNEPQTFSATKIWESSHIVLTTGQTLISDLDGDGFGEIISTEPSIVNSGLSNKLMILNGFTGELIRSIPTPYFMTSDLGSFYYWMLIMKMNQNQKS